MRRIRHIAAALALLLTASVAAWAQTRVLSGKVLDTGQQPVIGAAVMVSGTSTGDVTTPDGTFSLRVPAAAVTLDVSCLGYVSRQVEVPAGQGQVTIVLEEDEMLLEETVVVGYGVQKKVNLTGAVTAVDTKELDNRTTHNLTEASDMLSPTLASKKVRKHYFCYQR